MNRRLAFLAHFAQHSRSLTPAACLPQQQICPRPASSTAVRSSEKNRPLRGKSFSPFPCLKTAHLPSFPWPAKATWLTRTPVGTGLLITPERSMRIVAHSSLLRRLRSYENVVGEQLEPEKHNNYRIS